MSALSGLLLFLTMGLAAALFAAVRP